MTTVELCPYCGNEVELKNAKKTCFAGMSCV